MQFLRSVLFTVIFYLVSLFVGVLLLITAPVPMSVHRRFAGPRAWATVHLWLLKVIWYVWVSHCIYYIVANLPE